MPVNIRPEIEKLIFAVQNDTVHGAGELARKSVSILEMAARQSFCSSVEQLKTEQREIAQRLMASRPSMASVYNMINRLLLAMDQFQKQDIEALRNEIINCVEVLKNNSDQAVRQIARKAAGLMAQDRVIFTHSYSSTVELALKLVLENSTAQIIVTRSGAGRIGEKMIRNLSSYPCSLMYIDDTAMGYYVSKAQKVVVGADRICADGALVNGAGTYLLALAACRAGVPFYVLCETLKFDTRVSSVDVYLEEKDPAELTGTGVLPGKVEVKNLYFDITPLDLITGFITECGLIPQKEILAYLKK